MGSCDFVVIKRTSIFKVRYGGFCRRFYSKIICQVDGDRDNDARGHYEKGTIDHEPWSFGLEVASQIFHKFEGPFGLGFNSPKRCYL